MIDTAALNQHAKAIRTLGKRTLEGVIEIGRRLSECRTILKEEKQWLAWLLTEFNWVESTARNLMNVYDLSKSKDANFANADLPISTLYLLAAPSTSDRTRKEISKRVARGEKVKHKDVVAVTRKNKRPKPLNGLSAEIETAVKTAGSHGMIADEAKVRFGDNHDKQTVNTTFNGLKQRGVLRPNGERRKGRAEGGRAAEVLVWVPEIDRTPVKTKTKTPKATVISLEERRLIAMIEDDSICLIIAKWAEGKNEKARGTKAYRLIRPLIGKERDDLEKFIKKSAFGGAFADEQWNLHGGKTIGAIEFKTGK
jgi:Protein of unknown function (DUF3102)